MLLTLQAAWEEQLAGLCGSTVGNKIVCFELITELDALFVATSSGHLFLIHVDSDGDVEEVSQAAMCNSC